jgi:hypothetical protein
MKVVANRTSHQRNNSLITMVLVLVEVVVDIIIQTRIMGIMPKEEIDFKDHRCRIMGVLLLMEAVEAVEVLTSIHHTSIMDLLLFMEAPDFTRQTRILVLLLFKEAASRVLHSTARTRIITMGLPLLMGAVWVFHSTRHRHRTITI